MTSQCKQKHQNKYCWSSSGTALVHRARTQEADFETMLKVQLRLSVLANVSVAHRPNQAQLPADSELMLEDSEEEYFQRLEWLGTSCLET